MLKCKCKSPVPKYEECRFMGAKTGEYAAVVHAIAFKAVCESCSKLIGWYKDKPIQPDIWWCCGVAHPIDQRCSCGEKSDD